MVVAYLTSQTQNTLINLKCTFSSQFFPNHMGMMAVVENDQGEEGHDKRTIVLDLPTGSSISSKHITISKSP